MVAYSFKAQFIDPIRSGRKLQTIRADGKRRHARPDEALQLYTAMRTRSCRKLGDAICAAVLPVRIVIGQQWSVATLDGTNITSAAGLDRFAQDDGFLDWPGLVRFWLENHAAADQQIDFHGRLIRWKAFAPVA